MPGYIEGKDLDMGSLLGERPLRTELALFTIHNAHLKKLRGLDSLPLASLGLRWLSAPDLTSVPLPKTLTELSIWHCSKLRSLDGIEKAENLLHLMLEDNAPLEKSDAIGGLKQLTELSIVGGFTSMQKISSLKAIEDLPIKKLTLRAIAASDLDLSPVADLRSLQELDIHGPNFEPIELAKVAAAHSWFLDQLLDLEDYPLKGMRCKKCGGVQKQMFLKRKKFLWCPSCNDAGIRRALDGFIELVQNVK